MATYIGLIHKDQGTSYGVSFPDFPGCITGGDTLDEAMAEAPEALGFHIRGMLKDGDAIPAPSALEAVTANPENAGAVAIAVAPNMLGKGKAVRINITVEEALLAAIDAYAAGRGKTRSAFLADAARQAMT
jgi:predicted RNase H-like HicB family nuclease